MSPLLSPFENVPVVTAATHGRSEKEPEAECGPSGPVFNSAPSALLAAAKEQAAPRRGGAPRMVATVESPYRQSAPVVSRGV